MAKKIKNDATAFRKSKNEELFALVKDPKTEKIKIAVGNSIVSAKDFDTFEQAEQYIAKKPYELIINTACLFMHYSLEQNENKNETESGK